MDSIGHTRIPSTPLRYHEAERPIRPDVRARRNSSSGERRIGVVRTLRALIGSSRRGGSGGGGGRGKGVQTGSRFPQWMYAQRVVVKARVVRNRGRGGRRTMAEHSSYLRRDGVDREGGEGRTFGAKDYLSAEEVEAFVERSSDDRHHFRFIVSPERGAELDLTEYARDLMSVAERDLGTPLEWMAVAHHNTDNPHVHIIVRGVDERGADLVISRDYISRSLRERGQEIATRELGLRQENEIEQQRAQELRADRVTSVDYALEREMGAGNGVIDVRAASGRRAPGLRGGGGDRWRLEKIARLHHLETLGLASEGETGRWQLAGDAIAKLRELGAHARLTTSFSRFVDKSYEFSSIKLYDKSKPDAPVIDGELVGRGRLDELADEDTVFVASNRGDTAGRVYRLTLGPYSESAGMPLRVGQQVQLAVHRREDVSAADYNILAIAQRHGGTYSVERHRDRLESEARRGRFEREEVEERLARHVERIKGHEVRGFVERTREQAWRVPDDLVQRLEEYGRHLGDRRLTPRITARSPLTLDEQIHARGASWLDGQLVRGAHLEEAQGADEWSAPQRLRTALQERVVFLTELGMDVSKRALQGQELERLYRLEIQETLQRLRHRGQLDNFTARDSAPPEASGNRDRRVQGLIYKIMPLASGPHVVMQIRLGDFTMLPVRESAWLKVGMEVVASVRASPRLDPERPASAQSQVHYTDLQRYRERERVREIERGRGMELGD